MTEDIRAFIAVELPDRIKQKLSEIQERLKTGRSRAKWVAPESIHLTLKFLGGISPDTVSGVTQAMEEAVLGVAPFRLGVGGLGVFPDVKHVRVVWAGLTGDTAVLTQMQKDLDIALSRLGFTPESRPFTAHLTLARMRDEASPAERETVGKLVESTSFEGGDFVVDSLSLMRSQLRREGSIYTRMAAVPFVQ
jgi:RNA 2',3'-cyclic 3'-phosphodiesterase